MRSEIETTRANPALGVREGAVTSRGIFAGLLPGDGSDAGDRGLFRGSACLVRGGVDHWSVGWLRWAC